MTIRREYCDTAYGQIHYRVAGPESAPALILFHQSPSSSAMYEALMERLAASYRLYAPDTPGFGNSDALPQPVSIADYALAMKAFLDAMHVSNSLVFGHHTGASIAVQLEADFPGVSRAMALSGPTLLSDALKQALPGKASAFPLAEDGSHLLGMWRRMRDKEPDAPLALSLRETLLGLAAGTDYPQAYRAVIEQDFENQAKTVACPVLVFCGDADPLYGQLEASYLLFQNAEKHEIPGARSYACDLFAEHIASLLRDFFDRQLAAQAALEN